MVDVAKFFRTFTQLESAVNVLAVVLKADAGAAAEDMRRQRRIEGHRYPGAPGQSDPEFRPHGLGQTVPTPILTTFEVPQV